MGKPALSPPITLPVGPDYVIELPEGKMLSPEEQARLVEDWERAYPGTKVAVLEHGVQLRKVDMANPQTSTPWSMREDWNDTSKWLTYDSGMASRLRRKNGKTLLGVEMMLACLPGSVVHPTAWLRPFAYGLGFLLLLWGCMAWEKWIGWVMR